MTQKLVKDSRIGAAVEKQKSEQAIKEAEAFGSEDLERTSRKNAHSRKERFQDHLFTASLVVFWLLVVGIILAGACWFFHLLAPSSVQFLTDDQLDKLQTVLFTGVLSGVITGVGKKFI